MFRFMTPRQGKKTDRTQDQLIDLHNVKKVYKTEAGDFYALKGVNLSIRKGEFVGIIGKSGSGKSTLINMITGIDRPTTGEITVNGQQIHRYSEGQMAAWRGLNVGVVFQFFQLLPTLTVLQNVMLPMDFCNLYTPKIRRERAMELLTLVDVEQNAHKLPNMLSGGQQQRVAIARALANDPPMIVADEPTGSLDSKTANRVFELFEKLVDEGKTFLMVTHDDELMARVPRRVTIADGEIMDPTMVAALPSLTQQQQILAQHNLSRRKFDNTEQITLPETYTDHIYIVAAGQVRLANSLGETIGVANPGDLFGYTIGEPLTATADVADGTAEVVMLPRSVVDQVLTESPDVLDGVRMAVPT